MVRYGLQPDSPEVLDSYLGVAFEVVADAPRCEQAGLYYHLLRILLDVIADVAVPRQWRCLCLDHAHLPLIRLCAVARTAAERAEVRRLQYELSVTGNYFL